MPSHTRHLPLLPLLLVIWGWGPWASIQAQTGVPPVAVPAALEPWIPWVLEGRDPRPCPLDPLAPASAEPAEGRSRRAGDPTPRLCAWPGRLHLELGAGGGDFAQRWQLYAESWVPLPGDPDLWPQDTEGPEGPLAVVLREGRPAVKLPPGEHAISGRFEWTRRPEGLPLPPETGLVSLVLDGEPVAAPRRETDGRLWLGDTGQTRQAGEGERLGIRIYRRIEDDLPLRTITRLELEVAGRARLVTLGPVLLPGAIPLGVRSPVPSRLGLDGRLQLQVRPGSWVVEVEAQHPGLVETLTLGSAEPPWPELEVWSFAARADLRQVELSGAPTVDPSQSGVPPDWSRLPAYRLGAGDSLRLLVQRRGDPDPGSDRLNLSRDLWLDFDGGGYSVRDRLAGTLTRSWRLELAPPLTLGQIQVDGEPRLITRLAEGDPPGVEVRRGELQLVAHSRLEAGPTLVPASGWGLDLGSIRARLHLPPGWDLLALSGVDNLPQSWLARWTLLDLFLVLILTLGVARLWGWPWGILALAALVLTWQALGAPRHLWLHLLAGAALLRLLPLDPGRATLGRIRALVIWYFRLSLLALLVVGLPFLVAQVRDGLWPQLQRPWAAISGAGLERPPGIFDQAPAAPRLESMAEPSESGLRSKLGAGVAGVVGTPAPRERSPLDAIEPGARVQTGPGMPDWAWSSFDLSWSGPVPSGEMARLWLLTPRWNLLWSLTGALLVALLGLRMAGLIGRLGSDGSRGGLLSSAGEPWRTRVWPLLLLLAIVSVPGGDARAEPLPTPEVLGELQRRLLEPPDCLPDCVELSRLDLSADAGTLRLVLVLDAAAPVAAAIPGGPGGWLPELLTLDGEPLDGIRRGAGSRLLVPIGVGRHRVELTGPLPDRPQVEIPFPLRPRLVRAEVSGWTLGGLDSAGRPGAQLRLVRLSGAGAEALQTLVQERLPPLLRVERSLSLGIDSRVETRVRRLSPVEPPVLVPVPLLPGESVQTPGVEVREGQALASLGPGVKETGWSSSLEPQERLELVAASGTEIVESWALDLSPRWHLTWSGIPPVGQRSVSDRWLPTWRPLPGETLELVLTRPEAVPGPTLTLDRVDLALSPGRRASASELRLALRSTQGGTHAIRLPAGSEPVRFLVDGQERPLPPPGVDLELPLVPGSQSVAIEWREGGSLPIRLRPNGPDLGVPAVNLSLSLTLPPDRWVLFTSGPQMGPVVLFWAVLPVLAGLSLALARMRLTPLRAHDWLLLGVGLSLAQIWVALLVAGWLIALGLRERLTDEAPRWRYNLAQIGLVALTVAALAGLVTAVSQGLLGRPDMQILGNGSHGGVLNWYQDRGGPRTPEVSVISVPIWVYRALMLAWALWLALRLLGWLRWGWDRFSRPALWREGPPRPPRGVRSREVPTGA
ncbi:MAG: hypothetical protein ACM3ST_00070 [Bdellovibrio bacteriovorus]